MYSLAPLVLVMAASVRVVRSESMFLEPEQPGPAGIYDNNPVYEVGENIDVQWESDLETMDLYLWVQYPEVPEDQGPSQILDNVRSTSLIWEVTLEDFSIDLAENDAAVLWFALHDAGNPYPEITCHYFNVTDRSSVSSSQTSSSSPTTSSVGPTEATTDVESNDDRLSTGAVAGISVGATVAGLAILGVAAFFFWRCLRRRNASATPVSGAYLQTEPVDYKAELPVTPRAELAGCSPSTQPPPSSFMDTR